jgi:hypothetical protein
LVLEGGDIKRNIYLLKTLAPEKGGDPQSGEDLQKVYVSFYKLLSLTV